MIRSLVLGLLAFVAFLAGCSDVHADRPSTAYSVFRGDQPINYKCPLMYLPKSQNPKFDRVYNVRDADGIIVDQGYWDRDNPAPEYDFIPYTREQALLKWDALRNDPEYLKWLDERVEHPHYRYWTRGLERRPCVNGAISYRPRQPHPPGKPHEPWEKNA